MKNHKHGTADKQVTQDQGRVTNVAKLKGLETPDKIKQAFGIHSLKLSKDKAWDLTESKAALAKYDVEKLGNVGESRGSKRQRLDSSDAEASSGSNIVGKVNSVEITGKQLLHFTI